MVLLQANGISKSYGARTLFQGVSFDVRNKDRIGLIGANGEGKTTILHILNRQCAADEGAVQYKKDLRIGFLEQAPVIQEEETVLDIVLGVFLRLLQLEREIDATMDALEQEGENHTLLAQRQHALQEAFEKEGGLTFRSRARAALLGLGFSDEEIAMPALHLSGGQLNKVLLARVLLSGANLLLLDEPTNHLDIAAVEWLETFLQSYAGAYIVISHDRYFLDQVTNRTFELINGGVFITEGNYTRHVEQRMTEKEIAWRHYRNTQKEIKRIYGIVEQQRRWNRERNIRTAESKLKQIDRLKETLVAPEKELDAIRFAFQAREPGGNDVLFIDGLRKAYGEKRLFAGVSMLIQKSERVFLLGPNGCGKTTLLRILMQKEPADAGTVSLGAGVDAAYYEQNMRNMQEENSVLQEVWDAYPRLNRTQVHNALAAFLFKGEDVNKKIGVLSGGERARVQLLKLMMSGANLLLLDEPTNHLDIASREALEKALEEYEGALLVVTHDRYLVNKLADRLFYMKENGLVETIGGYHAYLEALQDEKSMTVKEEKQKKPQNAYQAKKERQVALAKLRGELSQLEKSIEEAEAGIQEIEEQLVSEAVLTDYIKAGELSALLEEKRTELEGLYQAWEEAAHGIEEMAGEAGGVNEDT